MKSKPKWTILKEYKQVVSVIGTSMSKNRLSTSEFEQTSWNSNKQGKIRKRISRNVDNIGKTEITKEINKIYQKLYERNIIKESNLINKYNFVKRK